MNWNVANEKYFKSEVINNLVVRATYGLTGNFDRSGSTTPIMVARRSYLASVNGNITRITTPPSNVLVNKTGKIIYQKQGYSEEEAKVLSELIEKETKL